MAPSTKSFVSSFTFWPFYCYFRFRLKAQAAGQAGLPWWKVLAIVALTGAALDSKEMAMTLPAALFLLEVIYFRPRPRSWRGAFRQMWTVLATFGLTAATIAVKVLTRNPLSEDTRYHSHSVHATLDAMRGYHNFLMYRTLSSFDLTTRRLVILWIVMAVPAVRWRSRPMIFGQLLLIVAILPVA